ncbi:SDR family oxidoreductase [Actinomadura atramentaria]|uniref:SDR family oxidoreductase n=1 Tax=Actinomadura atramentaria TaxID=1990 RepID=UPI0004768C03|nr:SDR family oxidoreductase [Actinomadura atramentaria]
MTTRTALVTGAGRGIGAATARELGRRGFHVVVNYRSDSEAAQGVVRDIEDGGGSALAVRADVTDAAAAAALVHDHGPLDALVCNANIAPPFAPVAELPWETFIGKVDGELAAVFHVTQAAMRNLSTGAGIVYVSSIASETTRPGAAAHSAAKAALEAFARHVAAELGGEGVSVNVVAPGVVRTEGSAAALHPAAIDRITRTSVLGRMLEADDVAALIAALAAGDLPGLAGARIPLDAGQSVIGQYAPAS